MDVQVASSLAIGAMTRLPGERLLAAWLLDLGFAAHAARGADHDNTDRQRSGKPDGVGRSGFALPRLPTLVYGREIDFSDGAIDRSCWRLDPARYKVAAREETTIREAGTLSVPSL